MMDYVSKLLGFVSEMMNSAFKMMNSVSKNDEMCSPGRRRSATPTCAQYVLSVLKLIGHNVIGQFKNQH